jgi:hypothetical protein
MKNMDEATVPACTMTCSGRTRREHGDPQARRRTARASCSDGAAPMRWQGCRCNAERRAQHAVLPPSRNMRLVVHIRRRVSVKSVVEGGGGG